MTHTASITYRIGTERESGYDEKFETRHEAADWLVHMASGHGIVSAWLDGKRVTIKGGGIVEEPMTEGQVMAAFTNELFKAFGH